VILVYIELMMVSRARSVVKTDFPDIRKIAAIHSAK
jgi:hypothetical protein